MKSPLSAPRGAKRQIDGDASGHVALDGQDIAETFLAVGLSKPWNGCGELKRAVCDVLRQANRPMTARQFTERVIAGKGLELKPGRWSKEQINRVRKVCQKLQTVDMVRVDGVQGWKRRAWARRLRSACMWKGANFDAPRNGVIAQLKISAPIVLPYAIQRRGLPLRSKTSVHRTRVE